MPGGFCKEKWSLMVLLVAEERSAEHSTLDCSVCEHYSKLQTDQKQSVLVIHKASNSRHRTTPFNGWCTHVEGSCSVCEHYSKLQTKNTSIIIPATLHMPTPAIKRSGPVPRIISLVDDSIIDSTRDRTVVGVPPVCHH